MRTSASGDLSLATGIEAVASGTASIALGVAATASGEFGIALGRLSKATATGSIAIGSLTQPPGGTAITAASAVDAVALGTNAQAAGVRSVALGAEASATGANSVAIGGGATATRSGQIVLGTAGSTYTAPGLGSAASSAAQSGVTRFVTGDSAGNLGYAAFGPADLAVLGARAAGLEAAQAALGGRVDALFDLARIDRHDARKGIAAAVAIGNAPMPSAPGRTSYVVNGAVFRGEYALGGSIMHRMGGETPFAVTAGFSFAGHKNNAARVGVAGEF
jgi:autotransporter adhesin